MATYSLRLAGRVPTGARHIADITAQAQNWQRSIRLQGGFWQGSFRVQATIAELTTWFYERLGCHVEERSGGQTTWEGLIYEMELAAGGVRRRRSLNTLANATACTWQRYDGRTVTTAFATNATSIAQYGRRETVDSVQGDEAAGEQRRNWLLTRQAWANPSAVSVSKNRTSDAVLDVQVCGYAFTANWRYTSGNYWDGTVEIGLSDWITELIQADCEFLTPGNIRSNTFEKQKVLQQYTVRCWDFLQELVGLGDASDQPWRLWVGPGRRAHYEAITTAPRYYLRHDGLFTTAGERTALNPYLVQPGVVRDLQYPLHRAEPGAFLTDARDILVEEVQVGADGAVSLRTGAADEGVFAAQEDAAARQRAWLDDYWSKASSADYEKRKREWEAQHPGVPFPG